MNYATNCYFINHVCKTDMDISYLNNFKKKKKLLGRLWHLLEYNFKMFFKTTRCEDEDWIHLAEDRKEWQASFNMMMNLLVLQTSNNLSIT